MSTVIKVENLSKQYRLGLVGTGTFKEDTKRFWAKIRGKEDPYSTLGEENDRTLKGTSDFVWSLRDINFEVQQGDVLGIIGKNGAGKSTLLKILSKVTTPTTGSVKAKGRIASLLEVGTGFHPELTGRENIYLNGAILGMRKHEITRKLDEIIAFAGVERYIDTPVKRYSSGMYVRLAFAVAAHLENEILIIDEVLAVGDADFQKKCLGKIGDVSKGDGRTVLFVSHNLSAVRELCNNGILLRNGKLCVKDDIDKCILEYQNNNHYLSKYNNKENSRLFENEYIKILSFSANPNEGKNILISTGISISVVFESKIDQKTLDLSFYLKNSQEIVVFSKGIIIANSYNLRKRVYTVEFEIANYTLNEDKYFFEMFWGIDRQKIAYKFIEFGFEVLNIENSLGEFNKSPGVICPLIKYKVK
jgi:lipopolysaccharide transport system ATP-binding protein